ncbi:amidohydrolase family protein [Aquimarina algiphila]|uniref:Amidohydrolase family protein n=1 Tax=Aquimarina algiphila TaxID=2047982 RepID=A0A554VCI9_9FLAO|nr:amidohydrolase family protein [Aquimarina algiphila]TSE04445.1 amidohydrolase family protein [Aquimarina algiphila]
MGITIIIVAILWPLPKLKVPQEHNVILIKSINIIDVKTGAVIPDYDILIKKNIITRIDSIIHPRQQYFIIDGTDKYIIPGLWNMHTHSTQHSVWLHHPLYIANGVTGIRDMSGQLNKKDSYWAGTKERLQWNKELAQHTRITPRYVLQSSYQMDGESSVPSDFPEFFKLKEERDIKPLLEFYQNENTDFIKVYMQIPPKSYRKLALEAPKYGMHIAGHKPIHISLEEAIQLGQRSFEHGRIFMYDCFPGADSLRTLKTWKAFYTKSKPLMVSDFNKEKAIRLMNLMKEKNAHWVPTLQTLKSDAFAHVSTFTDDPNVKYVPTLKRKLWWDPGIKKAAKKNKAPESQDENLNFYRASQQHVKMAYQQGVPIMAGTDVTDVNVFAGFSLHTELEDLTKSGLSNLEALQTATITPAKYCGLESKYGTIAIGKTADLVILNQNPLESITNTKKIYGVLLDGIFYDANDIKELKEFTASLASTFHMNIKVAFSLISSPLIRVQLAD